MARSNSTNLTWDVCVTAKGDDSGKKQYQRLNGDYPDVTAVQKFAATNWTGFDFVSAECVNPQIREEPKPAAQTSALGETRNPKPRGA